MGQTPAAITRHKALWLLDICNVPINDTLEVSLADTEAHGITPAARCNCIPPLDGISVEHHCPVSLATICNAVSVQVYSALPRHFSVAGLEWPTSAQRIHHLFFNLSHFMGSCSR